MPSSHSCTALYSKHALQFIQAWVHLVLTKATHYLGYHKQCPRDHRLTIQPFNSTGKIPEWGAAGWKCTHSNLLWQTIFPTTARDTPKMPECAHPHYFTYLVESHQPFKKCYHSGVLFDSSTKRDSLNRVKMNPKAVLMLLLKDQREMWEKKDMPTLLEFPLLKLVYLLVFSYIQ